MYHYVPLCTRPLCKVLVRPGRNDDFAWLIHRIIHDNTEIGQLSLPLINGILWISPDCVVSPPPDKYRFADTQTRTQDPQNKCRFADTQTRTQDPQNKCRFADTQTGSLDSLSTQRSQGSSRRATGATFKRPVCVFRCAVL